MGWQRRAKRPETTNERAAPPPSVRYRVAPGFERHKKLVAAATPLPEWAAQLPARAPIRGRFRRWRGWLVGALGIACIASLSWPSTPASESSARVTTTTAPAAGGTSLGRQPGRPVQARPEGTSAEQDPDPRAAAETRGEAALAGAGVSLVRGPGRIEAAREEPVAGAVDREPTAVGSPAQRRRTERAGATKSRQSGGSPQANGVSAALSADTRTRGELRDDPASAPGQRSRSGRVQSPQDREEMMLLAQAEHLLASEPGESLRLVREGDARFPHGYFRQERRYFEVMALFGLGQRGEARARAYWFLRDYPEGAYHNKVALALQHHPP